MRPTQISTPHLAPPKFRSLFSPFLDYEISGQMDWDFDDVHVVRGEKAQNKEIWPHLDDDTSPDTLLAKLQGIIQPWRNLYVATNELFYNYFDRLRSHYKVHLLDDYKELWRNTSEWYNETTLLNGGHPVEFDGYMRVVVDTEVLMGIYRHVGVKYQGLIAYIDIESEQYQWMGSAVMDFYASFRIFFFAFLIVIEEACDCL
ncbi:hypothetical protein L6452_18485 [Arctium lappa]|uniref:Uncharacterized protein n=1 Tax=Arctium lappa TaxID=4217 RepID=A0ACB9C6I3_ARCLA|nr:hypothetical protein L6452_18485 [Arctium lappa]